MFVPQTIKYNKRLQQMSTAPIILLDYPLSKPLSGISSKNYKPNHGNRLVVGLACGSGEGSAGGAWVGLSVGLQEPYQFLLQGQIMLGGEQEGGELLEEESFSLGGAEGPQFARLTSESVHLSHNGEQNGNRFVSNQIDMYEVLMPDESCEPSRELFIDFNSGEKYFTTLQLSDMAAPVLPQHPSDMLADQIQPSPNSNLFASFQDEDNDSVEMQKKQKKRKVRKTITQEVLDQLNHMFTLYSEGRGSSPIEEGVSIKEYRQNQALDLKKISKKLNLGYSTVLHKFSEFKERKVVKGGVRISHSDKARQYKKTLTMDEMVRSSLYERSFTTAVELSNYIQQKYEVKYPRAVLSRHLRIMGYSLSSKEESYDRDLLLKYRKNFVWKLFELVTKSETKVYYIDECEFKEADFMSDEMIKMLKKEKKSKIIGEGRLFSAVAFSNYQKGIIKYQVKDGRFNGEDFQSFLEGIIADIYLEDTSHKILIMDLKACHHTEKIGEIRRQCKASNIEFIYTPPLSEYLNLTNQIFTKIKDMVADNHEETIAMKREILTDSIRYFEARFLREELEEWKDMAKDAVNGRDFK